MFTRILKCKLEGEILLWMSNICIKNSWERFFERGI